MMPAYYGDYYHDDHYHDGPGYDNPDVYGPYEAKKEEEI